MRNTFLLCMLIPIMGVCQRNNYGIQFESDLSWQEVQAKAKAENKFIFMDCYATWCGPCKFMTDSIFTQKDVGRFMNEHFISVAVQVDQTSKDARPGDHTIHPSTVRARFAFAAPIRSQ